MKNSYACSRVSSMNFRSSTSSRQDTDWPQMNGEIFLSLKWPACSFYSGQGIKLHDNDKQRDKTSWCYAGDNTAPGE